MINLAQPTFLLGRYQFRLKSIDSEFAETVARMLPRQSECAVGGMPVQLLDLDAPFVVDKGETVDLKSQGLAIAVGCIVDRAIRAQKETVWLEGSILKDKQGRLVLLVGASQSGKTTLSLSMHLHDGWTIVSEDLVLLDPAIRGIVPFARPLGLREGTIEKIQIATGSTPESRFLLDYWYFDPSAYDLQPSHAAIAAAVILAPLNADRPGELVYNQISTGECIRKCLPMSNVIHRPEALDLLDTLLAAATCFVMHGGDLKSRVTWLSHLL